MFTDSVAPSRIIRLPAPSSDSDPVASTAESMPCTTISEFTLRVVPGPAMTFVPEAIVRTLFDVKPLLNVNPVASLIVWGLEPLKTIGRFDGVTITPPTVTLPWNTMVPWLGPLVLSWYFPADPIVKSPANVWVPRLPVPLPLHSPLISVPPFTLIVPEKAPVFHLTPGPIVRLPSIANELPPDAVQTHDPALLSKVRFPNVLPENEEAGVNTDEPR